MTEKATKEGNDIDLNIGEDIQKINKALGKTNLGDSEEAELKALETPLEADYAALHKDMKGMTKEDTMEEKMRQQLNSLSEEEEDQAELGEEGSLDELEKEDNTLEKVSASEAKDIATVENSMAKGVASEIKHPTGAE